MSNSVGHPLAVFANQEVRIYKDKYNDAEDPGRSSRLMGRAGTPEKEKRRNKSRTRGIFARKKAAAIV